MKITVSEINEEGLELELNDQIESDALKLLSPVHSVLRIDRIAAEVTVKGVVSSKVALQCGRCLKNFDLELKSRIDDVYRPIQEMEKEVHAELKGDELDTGFYSGDVIDTDDVLIEQLLLSAPMKPLCSEDCKGICPVCGADLNTIQCDCEQGDGDPRFAVLKKLKERKE
ncbi:MAG: DUF177 domain-containing protein [Nitrospirae bacterium]|nr:MAG: DUF177 domain-containing protein [Nitrospirota bacterium]